MKRIGILAVLLVALAGGAYAAIPDSSGVIHGCYDTKSGKLRVLDSEDGDPKACGKKETQLSWNQQGPQGEPGPQGPQGPAGQVGPQGPAGPAGSGVTIAELDTRIPYQPDDPRTFMDLGVFELRSPATEPGGDSDGTIDICNTSTLVFLVISYTGGPTGSTGETRNLDGLSPGCQTIDVNGAAGTFGMGDFRLIVPRDGSLEEIVVFGASTQFQGVFSIYALGL